MQAFVDKFRYNAKRASLVQSRIKAIERMAESAGITKSMLTVFISNQPAVAVYKKLGYVKDAASPEDRKLKSGKVLYKATQLFMSKEAGVQSSGGAAFEPDQMDIDT